MVSQVEDSSYMGPRIDKLMTAVHDAARDRVKQKEVRGGMTCEKALASLG
jgi:hypothetical protein